MKVPQHIMMLYKLALTDDDVRLESFEVEGDDSIHVWARGIDGAEAEPFWIEITQSGVNVIELPRPRLAWIVTETIGQAIINTRAIAKICQK